MPHLHSPILECPNCHADIRAQGRVEFDEDGSPDWTPEEPAICMEPACNVTMYFCCTTRCEDCKRAFCAEHLAKTDCGMLCAECEEEISAQRYFTEMDKDQAIAVLRDYRARVGGVA